jgi:hypothetical protein
MIFTEHHKVQMLKIHWLYYIRCVINFTHFHYFQAKGLNLSCVRICCVIAEERPRIQLTSSFTKLFADLGLSYRAVSTSFGCRVNIGISFPVSIPYTFIFISFKKYHTSSHMWHITRLFLSKLQAGNSWGKNGFNVLS